MPSAKADAGVTATELAKWLGITRQRIDVLADEGVIPRTDAGRYPLQPSILAYIGWLKDEARRGNKTAAASRLQDEKTRREALKTAREERELVPYAEAQAMVDDVIGLMASEVRALAERVKTKVMSAEQRLRMGA